LALIQLHDSFTLKTFHESEFQMIFLYLWIHNKIFIRECWQMRDYDECSFLKFKIATFFIPLGWRWFLTFLIVFIEIHVTVKHTWGDEKVNQARLYSVFSFFLLYSSNTVIVLSLTIFLLFFLSYSIIFLPVIHVDIRYFNYNNVAKKYVYFKI